MALRSNNSIRILWDLLNCSDIFIRTERLLARIKTLLRLMTKLNTMSREKLKFNLMRAKKKPQIAIPALYSASLPNQISFHSPDANKLMRMMEWELRLLLTFRWAVFAFCVTPLKEGDAWLESTIESAEIKHQLRLLAEASRKAEENLLHQLKLTAGSIKRYYCNNDAERQLLRMENHHLFLLYYHLKNF